MMVLVAATNPTCTRRAAGSHTVAGELVVPAVARCDDAASCSCARSWQGVTSGGFTGLAEVADRPELSRRQLRGGIHRLLEREGWVASIVAMVDAGDYRVDGEFIADPVAAVDLMVDDQIAVIDEICSGFREGAIVSRFGTLVAEAVRAA